MRSLLKLRKHALLLLLSLTMLAACQTMMTPIGGTEKLPVSELVSRVACSAFSPITYAKHDTPETRRQIVGHNAAWGAVCGEE